MRVLIQFINTARPSALTRMLVLSKKRTRVRTIAAALDARNERMVFRTRLRSHVKKDVFEKRCFTFFFVGFFLIILRGETICLIARFLNRIYCIFFDLVCIISDVGRVSRDLTPSISVVVVICCVIGYLISPSPPCQDALC